MKKTAFQKLEEASLHPYPEDGWRSSLVVSTAVAKRLMRQACREAFKCGYAHAPVEYHQRTLGHIEKGQMLWVPRILGK